MGPAAMGRVLGAVAAAALAVAAPSLGQERSTSQDPRASVLLLMDSSGSMAADDGTGTPKIDGAKRAVNGVIDALPAGARLGLRVFGGRTPPSDKRGGCRDSRLIFPLGRVDPPAMKSNVRLYRPKGFTPIALSLRLAARDLPREGRRTIVLVSDGEDTCGPPSPCRVAAQVARRGIDIRIQAIGFRVNARARRQLKCIARVGRGNYRDAEDAEELNRELRAVSTRAVRRYRPEGRPLSCGASIREAVEVEPGQYVNTMQPSGQCWYAVRLERGETLTAAATLVPPKPGIAAVGAVLRLELYNPRFNRQVSPGQAAAANLFVGKGEGAIESVGVYGLPAGSQGDSTVDFARDERFGEEGTYYLRVQFDDSGDRELRDEADGLPFGLELLVDVLGREPAARAPVDSRPAAAQDGGEDEGVPTSIALAAVAAMGVVGVGIGAALARGRRAA